MIKKPFAFLLIAMTFLGCQNKAGDSDLLDVGIPLKMAEYRTQQVSDVIYGLSFDIPESKEAPIPAHLKLKLKLHDVGQPLYLDFNANASLLKELIVNGEKQEIDHQKEHLIISKGLEKGDNTIEIGFEAGELSLNRNDDFLYTLLVPDRASTLFPCFDQPNIKARYVLDISAPKDWKVLCGSPVQSSTEQNNKVHHQFGESDPMSTYLFSFVAGKFDSRTENPGVFDMEFIYRETDSAKIKASAIPVFELHQKSVDFLKDYTQYEFPFQKLDFAAIPGFQYGGMEHVGAIQYRQSSLFLDESATERQKLGRAKLIAHETSHMWFGDLVTMDWFNDVWMKEVFANFMADKIINPSFPDVNHRLQFMTSHYQGAYGEDRTKGTNPIRQDLDNLKNAGSLYGGIIYNKAPIMMRQLEATIGEKELKDGIREYISNYTYGNATWNDLVDILDKRTPMDLKKWSEVWVNQSGRPILKEAITYEKGKIKKFSISQQAEDGSDKLWPQSFEVMMVYKDSLHKVPVSISEKTVDIKKAQGLPKPLAILYNSNAFGYGVFPAKLSEFTIISKIEDEVTRGYAYLNIYENILSGNLNAKISIDRFKKALQIESNELIHGILCGQISNLYWHYLSSRERLQNQPGLEQLLWNQLTMEQLAPNLKKNIFNLWEGIAYSDMATQKLFRIWNKEVEIQGLRLNKDDFTNMAMTLALYGHPESGVILDTARKQLDNPDQVKRFDFLRPALSLNLQERKNFFESFKDPVNREKESWVLTACGYIHHPLRQHASIQQLPLALDLLEEIQMTGDIFFPKRWLSSTVGQYQSEEAYEVVGKYLESHPDLNSSLRGKLLQASDNLYRYQQLGKD